MTREFTSATKQKLMPTSLGKKSEQTRRRIIDATKELISQGKYAAKITDIARAANIAQPHFYLYFSSVYDVVYAIAEEMHSTGGGFVSLSKQDWRGKQGFSLLRVAVESGITKWRENYAINSICALLADREEGRFRELRLLRYQFICDIFAEQIRNAQRQGYLSSEINPSLRGYQCVSILVSMAQQYDSLVSAGFSHKQIVDETTHLLLSAVGANL